MPCAPTSSPMTISRSPSSRTISGVGESGRGLRPVFLDDLERNPLILPRRRGVQEGAQRLRRTALLADHSTEVLLGDAQLQSRHPFAHGFGDVDRVRIAHRNRATY